MGVPAIKYTFPYYSTDNSEKYNFSNQEIYISSLNIVITQRGKVFKCFAPRYVQDTSQDISKEIEIKDFYLNNSINQSHRNNKRKFYCLTDIKLSCDMALKIYKLLNTSKMSEEQLMKQRQEIINYLFV